jgi:hypothetical protein
MMESNLLPAAFCLSKELSDRCSGLFAEILLQNAIDHLVRQ